MRFENITQCRISLSLIAILISILFASDLSAQKKANKKGLDFFERKIRPVLVSKCYSCHSAKSKSVKGELLVDSRDGIRRGGESGDAVVPFNVENSLLMQALNHETYEMPPEEKLSDEIIADFATWIKMGAPDPRDGKSELIKKTINFEEARKFWAFQPPQKSTVPSVKDSAWPKSEIDYFVLNALETKGLKPVADSDRARLVRRIYFDLVGYPPSPAQVRDFVSDESESAVQALVDKLIDTPQFGERWGRHWLDVARFAESNGRERNFVYPYAWRYRNYVFDSFSKDKPYNQFVREQIAGDLLANDAKNEEHRKELIIATGFLAIGPKTLNEQNKEKFKMDVVDEQIDVSTRAVMSLTVSCARCHDHKFDPIPTKEYYSIAGIFRSSNTFYGTQGGGNRHPSSLIVLSEDAADKSPMPAFKGNIAAINRKFRTAQQAVKTQQNLIRQLQKKKGKKGNAKRASNGEITAARKRLAVLQKQLAAATKQRKKANSAVNTNYGDAAMGMAEGKVDDAFVLVRGEVTGRGPKVPRGYLTILSESNPPAVESTESGRRELAYWMTRPENPLTSRVIVNRIWHHLFGSGIVPTVDNFGATGEKPSNQMLLDYLAVDFVESGWSIKTAIRKIMTSRSYQLSTEFDGDNFNIDPENSLVWRQTPRRLDAEAIRDAMLVSSGSMDFKRPEKSFVAKYKIGQQVNRGVDVALSKTKTNLRSVYLPVARNAVHESLQVFDFAEPSIIVGNRENTTVPSQSLYLLNNSFVIEQSEKLANRVLQSGQNDMEGRIRLAYEITLSRKPTANELQRAAKYINRFLEKASKSSAQKESVVWTTFCQTLLASAEFRYLN